MASRTSPEPGKFYMTDAFTDHAVRFIDDYGRKPEPYFLYLAYTAPHWPLHAYPEDIAKYRGQVPKGWDSIPPGAARASDRNAASSIVSGR